MQMPSADAWGGPALQHCPSPSPPLSYMRGTEGGVPGGIHAILCRSFWYHGRTPPTHLAGGGG